MKRFCIIANKEKDPDGRIAKRLAACISEHGGSAYVVAPLVMGTDYCKVDLEPGTECTIILGGDGTFLRGAKVLQASGIPVMGINLGHLGFLTAAEYQDADRAVSQLVNDEYVIEKKSLLKTSRNGVESEILAMNDVVIARSGFSRLIRLKVSVNGQMADNYQGDGVIIATPSGSTGYSLSAGGPVVAPQARTLVITPVCPHMLHARPFVISDEDEIEIEVCSSSRSLEQEATVTVDGDEVMGLSVGDKVTVRRAAAEISVVMLREISFWDRVRGKL
ncbi:MAG: NAD(+)/NADH kinase [Lachnospiraceae bacterium]|nr:NAD(+)/NADH kinase [Lachnospiraceae bacterium]